MWVELFDGSYRRLDAYESLKVTFEGGSNKWWVGDGVNANRIAPGCTTESEANARLRTLLQHVGLITI